MRKSVLLSVLLLIGCGAPDRTPDASADTTAVSLDVDPGVQAVCDSVAASWVMVPGARVEWGDTAIAAANVITDWVGDSMTTPPETAMYAGCHVTALQSEGLPPAARQQLYWGSTDWPDLWRLTADGPGGQVQTYQRGWVRCQVTDEWDGGDDSNPAYVPDPFFRQHTLCWRHSRQLTPADTARPPV